MLKDIMRAVGSSVAFAMSCCLFLVLAVTDASAYLVLTGQDTSTKNLYLVRSDDNGHTWKEMPINPASQSVEMEAQIPVLIGKTLAVAGVKSTTGDLVLLKQGSKGWEDFTMLSATHNAQLNINNMIYDAHRKMLFAVGDNGYDAFLLTSKDLGKTWQEGEISTLFPPGSEMGGNTLTDVASTNDRIIAIGTNALGVATVLESTDGKNWTSMKVNQPVDSLSSVNYDPVHKTWIIFGTKTMEVTGKHDNTAEQKSVLAVLKRMSSNGGYWTVSKTYNTETWKVNDAKYLHGQWIVSGQGGGSDIPSLIYSGTDPSKLESRLPDGVAGNDAHSIAFTGSTFVVLGRDNKEDHLVSYSSTDAENWKTTAISDTSNVLEVPHGMLWVPVKKGQHHEFAQTISMMDRLKIAARKCRGDFRHACTKARALAGCCLQDTTVK